VVPGLRNFSAVAGGVVQTLALKSDGSVWAWGDNEVGQLGDGTDANRNLPIAVPGLSNVTVIAAGYFHSLALDAHGTVWAWGDNDSGQLGDGTTTNRSQPVAIAGPTNVTALVGGVKHSLALAANGTVWSWGDNASGQLGDGTTFNRSHPEPVSGLDRVAALAASTFNLALRADGGVSVWGDNTFHQLATGTSDDGLQPQLISGLSDVLGVAAGADHALVLRRNGLVWAWGDNPYHQAGGSVWASVTNTIIVTNVATVLRYTTVTNVITVPKVTTTVQYVTVTNSWSTFNYFQRSYLDVIDYADAANPAVRDPVNIPGALLDLGYGGALLYTTGQHWTTNGVTDSTQWLDASAYDGVSAHLVDSLMLSSNWPHPVLVQGTNIFVGNPAASADVPNRLEAWTLPDSGKFSATSVTVLKAAANTLAGFGALLAVQEIDSQIELFDRTNPAALGYLAAGKPSGCLSYGLGNADGQVDRGGGVWGLWLPLGDYGVTQLPPPAAGSLP
jgi:alpha-tubulin suppressor-like RCC1 family protein